jgi:hypothetical protein
MEHKRKERTVRVLVFNIKGREHLRDLLKYYNIQAILELKLRVDSA